jgi:hypothetical protein
MRNFILDRVNQTYRHQQGYAQQPAREQVALAQHTYERGKS